MMTGTLAPALVRLAGPQRQGPYEPIRLEMIDTLVSAQARGPLEGSVWLSAWQRAVEGIRDEVMSEATQALNAAAQRSRYPEARLAQMRPNAEASETLLHRLLAEGMPLERLDGPDADNARTRARGAALQAGWDAAVRIAVAERGHWSGLARDIDQWRRPWRPLVIAGVAAIVVVSLLAAMLGGVIPAPAWFQPVTDWFWGLPWL